MITQTCDIVRECDKRPYIELAPLAEVDEDTYNHIKADLVPRFAYLGPLEAQKLVADFDRVMTVEKSVLARVSDHARLLGCETDEEQSRFVRALVRKRSRFAFPDSFVKAMSAIQDRVRKKHDKDTDEGDFLRAIWQIRVRADPSWNDPVPELTIYVLFREDQQILDRYERAARQLLDRFDTSTGFAMPELVLVSVAVLSTAVYLSTAPLDLDHLSRGANDSA